VKNKMGKLITKEFLRRRSKEKRFFFFLWFACWAEVGFTMCAMSGPSLLVWSNLSNTRRDSTVSIQCLMDERRLGWILCFVFFFFLRERMYLHVYESSKLHIITHPRIQNGDGLQ
jgi:hypothetical protein